jgi:hypothetical protein
MFNAYVSRKYHYFPALSLKIGQAPRI